MYETTVSIEREQAFVLDKIEKRLQRSLEGLMGVFASGTRGSRAYLSIACKDEGKSYAEECLSYAISDIYLSDFKSEFIRKNANFVISSDICYGAFISALTAFDRETDRELVLERLKPSEFISIDGVYNFMLSDIRKRWQGVVDLADQNNVYLMYDETFIELMRFLTEQVEPKANAVTVVADAEGVSIQPDQICGLDNEVVSYVNLLPALIDLAPQKITLKGAENLPSSVKALFKEIYCDRTIYA